MAAVRDIRTCLPLLASVLGNDYGVDVCIGGDNAYTDGRSIHIPDLPLDATPFVVRLASGFLDHEAAHVRETDFDALREANFNPVQHHIWNTLEDRRVEIRLAALFPGCRENFAVLIRELFTGKDEESAKAGDTTPAFAVLDYLLLTVRSWDVPEVAPVKTAAVVDRYFPGLRLQLDAVLTRYRAHCPDTQSAILYTGELWDILERWQPQEEKGRQEQDAEDTATDAAQTDLIQPLQSAEAEDLPQNLGEAVGEILQAQAPTDNGDVLRVANVGEKSRQAFSAIRLAEIARQTVGLRMRLQGLLQAQTLTPCVTGRRGRLNPEKLYRLSCDDARLFRNKGLRRARNTAVHLLLDVSSSMQGAAVTLACAACYAAASALQGVHGVNLGVTAFPAAFNQGYNSVVPLVRHGERMGQDFLVEADGGTPLAEALWWVLQQMQPLRVTRRIILVLTDGEAQSVPAAQHVLRQARRLDYEVYGIGILDGHIAALLPDASQVITTLGDLHAALFALLFQGLAGRRP